MGSESMVVPNGAIRSDRNEEDSTQGNVIPPVDAGYDLPNLWCFGLAHPYIRRLVARAIEIERTGIQVDADQSGP
jgi:hypothetical protein